MEALEGDQDYARANSHWTLYGLVQCYCHNRCGDKCEDAAHMQQLNVVSLDSIKMCCFFMRILIIIMFLIIVIVHCTLKLMPMLLMWLVVVDFDRNSCIVVQSKTKSL